MAALFLLLPWALATAAGEPDIRVQTFREVCIDARENYASSRAAAEARGWIAVDDSTHPELRALTTLGRTADSPATPIHNMQAFHRGDGSPIYIVLSDLTVQGTRVNGCYVYDFEANEALPAAALGDLLVDPPSEALDEPGVLTSQKWVRPRGLPSVATIRLGYVPSGSPAVEVGGFDGLALAITSISQ